MFYQKLSKEEMKSIFSIILDELTLEQGILGHPSLYDFKKLSKDALERIQKQAQVKDKRKVKRIFEKLKNSNGEIQKIKNCNKIF